MIRHMRTSRRRAACREPVRRRAGARRVSRAADHPDRAVGRGRRHRCDRAHDRLDDGEGVEAAGQRREPHRRLGRGRPQAIASARPDGYTIGLITLEINMMHWVGLTELTYEGYTPFALINTDAAAIHVKTDSPYKSVKELFAHIKANPEQGGRVGIGAGRQLASRARRADAGRRHRAELDPLGAGDGRCDRAHGSGGGRGRVRVVLDAGGRGADQGRPHPQPDLHVGDARREFPRRADGRGSDRSQVAQGRVARHGRPEGPAEGDRHAIRDRDQEDLGQRGVSGLHEASAASTSSGWTRPSSRRS